MTWVSLTLWPFISTALFSNARLPIALLVTIIGGYLLLPTQTGFDLPILPPLNKHTIPAFIALVFVLVKSKPQGLHRTQPDWPVLPGILPRDPVVLTLFLLLFVGQLGTHMLNGDALFYGPTVLPGLRLYDAFSAMMATALQFVPFLLARKVLSSSEGFRLILITIAIAAAAYAFLALYEVRMSPQINQMVYGFFPHSFAQHWRGGGGWRPIVFLEHGLRLSLFFALAVISAAVMIKVEEGKTRTLWVFMMLWLFFALIMSKSLGALLIAIVVLGAHFMLPKRGQILFIFGITVCILLYPIVRTAGILPYEQLLSVVSDERANSLNYRLNAEQLFLDKANERPIFGWGGWGRSRIYLETGRDVLSPDGAWVIQLGLGGWLKYLSFFGLLSYGLLRTFLQRGQKSDTLTIGLALVLTGNLIDLIPNSGMTPVTLILAGALCGRLEYKKNAAATETNIDTIRPISSTKPSYSRFIETIETSSQSKPSFKKVRETSPYRRNLDEEKR